MKQQSLGQTKHVPARRRSSAFETTSMTSTSSPGAHNLTSTSTVAPAMWPMSPAEGTQMVPVGTGAVLSPAAGGTPMMQEGAAGGGDAAQSTRLGSGFRVEDLGTRHKAQGGV